MPSCYTTNHYDGAKNQIIKWERDCCLTPNEKMFSYVMARACI
jgi:hypothetical protein